MSTEKKRQIKNSFLYLLPVLIGNAIPILTLPLFTRILTPGDYGLLALAQIYATFAMGLANCGMQTAYQRNFFQYEGDPLKSSQLLYSVLAFTFLNFAIIAVVTLLLSNPIAAFLGLSESSGNLLFWAFSATFASGSLLFYLTFLRNEENARGYASYVIVCAVLDALLSVFMVAYLKTGPVGLVWAQLISAAAVFAFLSVKFARRLRFSLDFPIFKEAFLIAYPLTPRIFFGTINSQFDKYMVGLLANLGGVGIYDIGQKLANVVFVYMTAIQNVYSPQVYKRMFRAAPDAARDIGRYLTPFAYLSLLPAVLLALFSEECIVLLTPRPFHAATDIVVVLTLYFGSLFFGKINGDQLIFAKKTHLTSLLTLINLALNVALNLLFIPRWGAMGAAAATLLASLVTTGVMFPIAQRAYRIDWEAGRVAAVFALFFASGTAILTVRHYEFPYPARLGLKLACLGAYAWLGAYLGILSRENARVLKGIALEKYNSLWPVKTGSA